MEQIFNELIKEWYEQELPKIKGREAKPEEFVNWRVKKIVPIIGFRRVGKTFLLLSIAKKFGKENTVYINFEDERILEKELSFHEFYSSLREIRGNKKTILLLDEVQNIPNWSRWLRTLNDMSNFFVFATGSSSKLSSKEIPTELRGRALPLSLYPLSFREYLQFKEQNPEKMSELSLLKELKEYLKFGGFPEVVLSDPGKKHLLIEEYFNTFVTRDLFERYNIRNKEVLRTLIRILLNSPTITISKLYNTLKSLNLKIGKATIASYLLYLSQTFFVDFVELFSFSIKNSLKAPRKVYFIDNFFLSHYSSKFSENLGRLMENLVFLELKRRGREIYYWKDYFGREVDFVIKEGLRIKQLVQVCYDIGDFSTRKRELNSLIKAARELKCRNLSVITWDFEGEEKIKGRIIEFVPLKKLLLSHTNLL